MVITKYHDDHDVTVIECMIVLVHIQAKTSSCIGHACYKNPPLAAYAFKLGDLTVVVAYQDSDGVQLPFQISPGNMQLGSEDDNITLQIDPLTLQHTVQEPSTLNQLLQ